MDVVSSSAEGSGRTVEAAVEAARTKLGVPRSQLDVEILQQPVTSSFGVTGSPARVRATVRDGAGGPAPTLTDTGAPTVPTAAPATNAAAAPASTPAVPVAPVAPEAPATPVAPVAPEALATPVAPVVPVAPVAPATPATPATPVAPVAPEVSAPPVAPEAPATLVPPAAPAAPAPPATPATPVAPAAPAAPTAPVDAASRPARRPRTQLDPEVAVEQAEVAGDFVEGLLELLDLEADITTWADEAGGHVDVEGPELDFLVGRDGDVLAALEELTRLVIMRQTTERVRVSLDVAGFRQQRRVDLAKTARETAERVLRAGLGEELPPMPPYERKIVHDAVADLDGVATESVGEEPNRRVAIVPA